MRENTDMDIQSKDGDAAYIFSVMADRFYAQPEEVAHCIRAVPSELKYAPRKSKTIALFYNRIYGGGIQHVVVQLCNLFAAQEENGVSKYNVVLVCEEGPREEEYTLSPSVKREFLPPRENFPKEAFYVRSKAWHDIIERNHIDVVFDSAWRDPITFWDMLAVKSHPSHPAFVLHTHSFCGRLYDWDSRAAMMRCCYAMADGIVTLSREDTKFWMTVNPRTYMIENPCCVPAAGERRAKAESRDILWLARIDPAKQPLEIVRIMKYVCAEVPEAVCRVVGRGDDKTVRSLRAAIRKAGLEKQIILEGFHKDVRRFYEKSAVFLLTSCVEGFALTLFESAAYGLPTVLYDLPWLSYYDLIDGFSPTPQMDAEAAAREIIQLLRDKELWQRRSDKIYESFLQYQDSDIAGKWTRLLRDLETGAAPEETVDEEYGLLLDHISLFHNLEIMRIQATRTWRIGRAVTWLPRMIRDGIRYYREHEWSAGLCRIGDKLKQSRK